MIFEEKEKRAIELIKTLDIKYKNNIKEREKLLNELYKLLVDLLIIQKSLQPPFSLITKEIAAYTPEKSGRLPLVSWAANANKEFIVDFLLQVNNNLYQKDLWERDVLHYLILHNMPEALKKLKIKINFLARNDNKLTYFEFINSKEMLQLASKFHKKISNLVFSRLLVRLLIKKRKTTDKTTKENIDKTIICLFDNYDNQVSGPFYSLLEKAFKYEKNKTALLSQIKTEIEAIRVKQDINKSVNKNNNSKFNKI